MNSALAAMSATLSALGIGLLTFRLFRLPSQIVDHGQSPWLPGVRIALQQMRVDSSPLPARVTRIRSSSGTPYGFVLARLDDGRCRAYIRSQPHYPPGRGGLHLTHRNVDPQGRLYICFEPEPNSPDQLATVIGWWVEATDSLIAGGDFVIPEHR